MSSHLGPQDLNRITASAEQILRLHHGAMNSFDLVLEVMKSCMKGVRPDLAVSLVDTALEDAVRSKHLVLRGSEYFLPLPPKPPVAYVPHAEKVAATEREQAATRTRASTRTRTRQAAIKPAPPPVVNQPISVPSGPMTVKLPPKPAPPPPPAPPEPAPWRTDEYVMEPTFTQHPSQVGPMRQESLFDLAPRPKPTRKPRASAAPPVDGHEMRQAGFGLPLSATPGANTPNRDDDTTSSPG